MATSRFEYLPSLCQMVVSKRPRSILDIGVGFGKNGLLCREYSELWGGKHDVLKPDWTTQIDGVEAFEPYIQRWQRAIYDDIHIGDAFEVLQRLPAYDLIVMTDVIEHFEEAQVLPMLQAIKNKSQFFLVTTPVEFHKQGAVSGNEFERHRCIVTRAQLARFGTVVQAKKTLVLTGAGTSAR